MLICEMMRQIIWPHSRGGWCGYFLFGKRPGGRGRFCKRPGFFAPFPIWECSKRSSWVWFCFPGRFCFLFRWMSNRKGIKCFVAFKLDTRENTFLDFQYKNIWNSKANLIVCLKKYEKKENLYRRIQSRHLLSTFWCAAYWESKWLLPSVETASVHSSHSTN